MNAANLLAHARSGAERVIVEGRKAAVDEPLVRTRIRGHHPAVQDSNCFFRGKTGHIILGEKKQKIQLQNGKGGVIDNCHSQVFGDGSKELHRELCRIYNRAH